MKLFINRTFRGGILVNLLSVVALVGFLFFVSQHLQIVLGLEPISAGLVLLPGLLIMIIVGLVVVPIARRVPAHIVVPLALLVSAAAYLIIAAAPAEPSLERVMLAFAMLGAGIGAAETISNDLILNAAPADKAGAASALSETAYEVGAVLGTALLGGILTANYRANIIIPAGLAAEDGQAARETLAGAHNVAHRLGGASAEQLMQNAQYAFESGVAITAAIGAALMVAAAIVAWQTLRPSTRRLVSATGEKVPR